MLCTHTYLSSSTLVLHCVASTRASKGPLRCRRWTFESSPITRHHVGYVEFPHLLRATVQKNRMFLSSSPPTYIASIRRFGCSPYQHAPASDPPVHVDEKAAQLRCTLCVFMPSSPAKLAFAPYPSAPSRLSEQMADRMPEENVWQKVCQNRCQIECQIVIECQSQSICQKECQIKFQTRCKIECQNLCQIECQIECQTECQIECQIECQTECEIECQIDCQIGFRIYVR